MIFDPQSQEENDRLDNLLGATTLWQTVIEKLKPKIGNNSSICPFSELHPVGWADNGDAIGVVVAGAIGKYRGEGSVSGQWFAVRIPAGSETELIADLETEIETRRQKLVAIPVSRVVKPNDP